LEIAQDVGELGVQIIRQAIDCRQNGEAEGAANDAIFDGVYTTFATPISVHYSQHVSLPEIFIGTNTIDMAG
jgi:hypothetical protein